MIYGIIKYIYNIYIELNVFFMSSISFIFEVLVIIHKTKTNEPISTTIHA